MIADVESVELVEPTALPPGEYEGRWRGRTVRLYDYTSLRIRTADSVGDMDAPCVVRVDASGVACVELTL